jgi:hypothetical protein
MSYSHNEIIAGEALQGFSWFSLGVFGDDDYGAQ